jgi:hypothetical protein
VVNEDRDHGMSSKRQQQADNPFNKRGSKRGRGTRAKRLENQGSAVNKYADMGRGDKEKVREEGFDIELVKRGGGYWIYGKVRFHDISFGDEGYSKGELEFLYPAVEDISDFCRINKQERFYQYSGGVRRHYVHVESGGIVGAVIENKERVSDRTRLEDLIPGVLEYISGRDEVQ